MARTSPIGNLHARAEAETIPCAAPGEAPIELVSTFGELELEYAAIRRGCALFDLPHRAVLSVRGEETMDFLNRMLTQRLDDLAPQRARRSFWLNRKGRLESDLRVIRLPDRVLLELDAHAAPKTKETLESYLIVEDVTIEDETTTRHRLSLHGPRAAGLLAACAAGERVAPEVDEADNGDASDTLPGDALTTLEEGQVATCVIAGAEVLVDRQDALGVPGYELHMAADDALPVWERLCEVGLPEQTDDEAPPKQTPHRLRPAGWHAYNIARVEAGWPLFYVDFGPNTLPHETGVVHDRVSFKKGCFLGQEVVARMESRGAGKQILSAIRMEAPVATDEPGRPVQPITGEAVLPGDDPEGSPIGVVTSSVVSPMLGEAPICFAQVKRTAAQAGAAVLVEAQGSRMPGVVQESLRFLAPAASG